MAASKKKPKKRSDDPAPNVKPSARRNQQAESSNLNREAEEVETEEEEGKAEFFRENP